MHLFLAELTILYGLFNFLYGSLHIHSIEQHIIACQKSFNIHHAGLIKFGHSLHIQSIGKNQTLVPHSFF